MEKEYRKIIEKLTSNMQRCLRSHLGDRFACQKITVTLHTNDVRGISFSVRITYPFDLYLEEGDMVDDLIRQSFNCADPKKYFELGNRDLLAYPMCSIRCITYLETRKAVKLRQPEKTLIGNN